MRFFLFILIVLAVLISNCTKPAAENAVAKMKIELNTTAIYADGLDELQLSATDPQKKDVSTLGTFYINDEAITGSVFTTQTKGAYKIQFSYNGEKTDPVTIQAIGHDRSFYTKKIVLEEFAGAWCGYCPRLNSLVDSAYSSNPSIIPVSVHNGDGMKFEQEEILRETYRVSSFPAVFLNRTREWDESLLSLNTELARKAKCGLALHSVINGSTISVTARVKFDISTSLPLQLVVMLLEDNIIASQVNLYNNAPSSPFYNAGNPIADYTHQHVLREAPTGILGQRIPVGSQQKGKLYEQSFSIAVPAGFNFSNGKIVAFVQYAENSVSRFGILNAQMVRAGFTKEFD